MNWNVFNNWNEKVQLKSENYVSVKRINWRKLLIGFHLFESVFRWLKCVCVDWNAFCFLFEIFMFVWICTSSDGRIKIISRMLEKLIILFCSENCSENSIVSSSASPICMMKSHLKHCFCPSTRCSIDSFVHCLFFVYFRHQLLLVNSFQFECWILASMASKIV